MTTHTFVDKATYNTVTESYILGSSGFIYTPRFVDWLKAGAATDYRKALNLFTQTYPDLPQEVADAVLRNLRSVKLIENSDETLEILYTYTPKTAKAAE